jgi:four helix bundle protein
MKHPSATNNTKRQKPYDIRERSMHFACNVIRIVQELQRRGGVASALSLQLLNAAMNAAANLEEADDGSSPRDFRAKDRTALRELKETRLRLRVLRLTGFLDEKDDPVIQESIELVNIVATIIRNSARTNFANDPRTNPRTKLGFGSWDLGFDYWVSPVSRGEFPRGEPGVTSNENLNAGILLPG